jgi:hypothetical protein
VSASLSAVGRELDTEPLSVVAGGVEPTDAGRALEPARAALEDAATAVAPLSIDVLPPSVAPGAAPGAWWSPAARSAALADRRSPLLRFEPLGSTSPGAGLMPL